MISLCYKKCRREEENFLFFSSVKVMKKEKEKTSSLFYKREEKEKDRDSAFDKHTKFLSFQISLSQFSYRFTEMTNILSVY